MLTDSVEYVIFILDLQKVPLFRAHYLESLESS